jgi:hypothetical protein
MVKLSREVTRIIVEEYSPREFLQRISDPLWFQALGSFVGFDWHSSGLTTTLCGALKEALEPCFNDLRLFVCGGKGAASRKTPDEIRTACERAGMNAENLVYASRITAKVDSAAVQDGYQIYHHSFIFTDAGDWAVIQQGMNENTRYARRYHWLSLGLNSFVCEPHKAIISDRIGDSVLNLVAKESEKCRNSIVKLLDEKSELKRFIDSVTTKRIVLPSHHEIRLKDFDSNRLMKSLSFASEMKPADFESLLVLKGVGAKTLRALSLAAELIYSSPPSFRDPARFAFAHGGKDGHPYPVNKATYDETIQFLRGVARKMKVSPTEKENVLRRLARL